MRRLLQIACIAIVSCTAATAEPIPFADRYACELETYQVLDDRRHLSGVLIRRSVSIPQAAESSAEESIELSVVPLDTSGAAAPFQLSLSLSIGLDRVEFSIPISKQAGGYYRLEGGVVDSDGALRASGPCLDTNGSSILFSVRELKPPSAAPSPRLTRADYLAFVRNTIDLLASRQSLRLGERPDGARFLTVTRPVYRSYRSIGYKRDDGTYENYWFPEMPIDFEPFIVDMDLWPILRGLSEALQDSTYDSMLASMADAFASHGFDARSGLGYLGEEAALDVRRGAAVSTKTGVSQPQFKPKNTGSFPGLPLDVLWKHAPAKTHRMFRAMYYGLVTDPESMDFNRYCHYEFSDADKTQVLTRNSAHCAFDSVAARMIHWWASCYAQTGDPDCLDHAQRMADKWRAVQHRESGLVPNFFGAVASNAGVPMPPGDWAESRSAALTAAGFLDAADELRKRTDSAPLAAQLTQMAVALANGVARHSYDPERRVFREYLQLDGGPYLETARYTFRTQEEKNEAVKRDPVLAEVSVYDGAGLYTPLSYWEHCAGSTIPLDLAQVMRRVEDETLTDALRKIASDIIDESRKQRGPFTSDGAWTFRANGEYIHALVLLHEKTGNGQYLDWAREIADRELAGLQRVVYPHWWRMPDRAALLDGLLALHAALEKVEGENR